MGVNASKHPKPERTERMVREAVQKHPAFDGYRLVLREGPVRNNTNVQADSDVDIAVQCNEVEYWGEAVPGAHPSGTPYQGLWTPNKLRAELGAALRAKFPRSGRRL